MIPNPIVRTVAVAAAGLAVERLVNGRRRLPGTHRPGRLTA
jgi:hypothetical protein